MKKCFIQYSMIKITLAALAAAVALLAAAPARADTSWARGGNWAATAGLVDNVIAYPDGITSSTTPTQAAAVADTVAGDYALVGINFVRYPINPATVSGNWAVTTNAINELIAKGMTVDICCWYISATDGLITNMMTWSNMWKTVDAMYKNNSAVYYEPINEPFGYTSEPALATDVYVPFLAFINKTQGHLILDGTNYAAGVTFLGADSRFNNCLLAVHDYAMWEPYTSDSAWSTDLYDRVNPYQGRTIMTEMGAATTTGLDYQDSSTDSNVCFVQGMCNQCVSWGGMGFTWFPAHQAGTGNNKRMFTGPGGQIFNGTLIPELQYGWDWYTVYHDFYGKGYYDYAMFQPGTGDWWIKDSANGGGGTNSFQWGTSGDIPLVGNSAESTDDAADAMVWRPSTGTFYVRNSDGGSFTVALGSSGDIPFVGNFYGSGNSAYCVVKPNYDWWVKATPTSGTNIFQWGTTGDVPLVGNCSGGDNCADAVVWRVNQTTGQGTFWVRRSEDGTSFSANWGTNGDVPMLADFTGDGKDDFVVWRPSNGNWYIMDSQSLESVPGFNFGIAGDVPMCGMMNGDMCAIIYRPSNHHWYVWDPETGSGIGAPQWGDSSVNPVK